MPLKNVNQILIGCTFVDWDQVQQRLAKYANILELILKVLFLEKWKIRRSKFNGNLYLNTRDFTEVQNF
ncbi:hypothetical protein BBX32_13655 [Acinetobacter baumannii]|nr:hypothetical protein BBX32_13655 [Acinetobacter baumannii]